MITPTLFRVRALPAILLGLVASLAAVSCSDQGSVLEPDGPSFASEEASPCLESEDPKPGDTTCYLGGIKVKVPSKPDVSEPPPPPSLPSLPAYTPTTASSSTGSWGRIWTFESALDGEAQAPPIGGAYDDGPVVFAACVLGTVAAANLYQVLQVKNAMDYYTWALGQANEYEVRWQIAYENQNAVGEELLIVYQELRDNAQRRLNQAREDVLDEINQHKSVSAIAFSSAVLGCAVALWAGFI